MTVNDFPTVAVFALVDEWRPVTQRVRREIVNQIVLDANEPNDQLRTKFKRELPHEQ
jgi:hypothetical protein